MSGRRPSEDSPQVLGRLALRVARLEFILREMTVGNHSRARSVAVTTPPAPIMIADVIRAAAEVQEVELEALIGRGLERDLVTARAIAIDLAVAFAGASSSELARRFLRRKPAILRTRRVLRDWMAEDRALRARYRRIAISVADRIGAKDPLIASP